MADTAEALWSQLAVPPLDLAGVNAARVVVVAPHPDDEVLAAGGTLAQLHAAGHEVELIAVTDGEASHPGRADELRTRRPQETAAALARLDLASAPVQRLRLADGGIDGLRLDEHLRAALRRGDLVLAPWAHDGHPDHEAVGSVTARVCADLGLELWAYPVWMWHWSRPDSMDIPWASAFRVDLPSAVVDMKASALACFTSQLEGPAPVLPEGVLAHFRRTHEVFFRP